MGRMDPCDRNAGLFRIKSADGNGNVEFERASIMQPSDIPLTMPQGVWQLVGHETACLAYCQAEARLHIAGLLGVEVGKLPAEVVRIR
jgi:hypothetical protein